MKYTSKDIIERAMNLADISNTDFLTHKELTQYINDAWQTVFQWLINKGDTQFIKEVELVNGYGGVNGWTEYELPEDLYQIKSLKNKYSGDLVSRHSESQGINSNTYDVVNDKLRLYGVAQNPLMLTYWVTPTFITFPDRDIESVLSGEIVSTAGNAVLTKKDGVLTITNVVSGETLGAINIPDNTYKDTYILGNGHVVFDVEEDEIRYIKYLNYDGVEVSEYNVPLGNDISYFLDEEYNVCFQILADGKYSAPIRGDMFIMNSTLEFDRQFVLGLDDLYITGKTIDGVPYITVYDANEDEYWEDIPLFFNPTTAFRVDDYDLKPAFLMSDGRKWYLFALDEKEQTMTYDDVYVKALKTYGAVRHGIITSNGTIVTVRSYIPDTEMNFPNEMYFSLLACDLALRFAMKMNANTDGLNNLCTNMQTTFMNTLSQTSDYTRIKKAYR